jgi:hypothetical protein
MNPYLSYSLYLTNMLDTRKQQDDWKQRIIEEFKQTKFLPRKKKKQKRKELQLDWNIANWNPFEF